MSMEDFHRYGAMKLYMHHIYEFQKGVRNLVLCTMCPTCASLVCSRLDNLGIHHAIQQVSTNKVNLFFGNELCLNVVRSFIHKPLNELSAEEDFILGVMLGYDITGQCERYFQYKNRNSEQQTPIC